MTVENRWRVNTQGAEIRQDDNGDTVITGYASVFYRDGEDGTEYRLADQVYERIDRKAFDRAIEERHDVAALFNHDPSLLMGRTSAGTVTLTVDDLGLRYDIVRPEETETGRRVLESMKRGDITGSSFAFIPTRVRWEEDGERDIRQVEDLELVDVSPVTYPAYRGTTAGVRNCAAANVSDAMEEHSEWRAHKARTLQESQEAESAAALEAFKARALAARLPAR